MRKKRLGSWRRSFQEITSDDTDTNQWTTKDTESVESSIRCATAVADTGKTYFIGGQTYSDQGALYNTFKIYDIKTGVWSNGPTLTAPGRYAATSCIVDRKIYVIGANRSSTNGNTKSILSLQLTSPSAINTLSRTSSVKRRL